METKTAIRTDETADKQAPTTQEDDLELEEMSPEDRKALILKILKPDLKPLISELKKFYGWSEIQPEQIIHSHTNGSASENSKWRTAWFTAIDAILGAIAETHIFRGQI